MTHPLLGRCLQIYRFFLKKKIYREIDNSTVFDNLTFYTFIPSLVEGSSEVCVSSAEEALALYETGKKTLWANTSSIYSRWVQRTLTL